MVAIKGHFKQIHIVHAKKLLAFLLIGFLANKQGHLRSKITKKTEYRIKIMNELVSGIQVIKMYAWEKPFQKVVDAARK